MKRATELAVRIGLPIGIVAVVVAVFLGEQLSIDHELSIVVPEAVVAGEATPVRAFVFEGLEAGTPALGVADVEMRIVDRSGTVRSRAALRRSVAGGVEGSLLVPRELRGWITVQGIARIGGEIVARAETSIEAKREVAGGRILRRELGPLSQLRLGPVRGEPLRLDARVAGGACVPESRCEVLVDAGDLGVLVSLVPIPALTTEAHDWRARHGIVVVPVVVHGPEAHTEIVARRDGVEVARRTITLPVGLAVPGVQIDYRVPWSQPRMRVDVLGDRPGIIVDAYRDGRWVHTGSFAPSSHMRRLPFELDPGLWRLQVHTDPFSSERSGVRIVAFHLPSESHQETVERLALDAPRGLAEDRLAWASAPSELGTIALPDAMSGYADDLGRLELRRRTLRLAAVVALFLGLAIAAIFFVRRGLDAAAEAQRVMDETGDPELTSAPHRRRTLLSALLVVAAILLAFVGAAALIVARAHLLE